MGLRRGDIVIVALPGDYGKPRPAVIVQSNEMLLMPFQSVIVCPMTTDILPPPHYPRITVFPSSQNGLKKTSQIMTDKVITYRLEKIGQPIGHLEGTTVDELNITLAFILGLTD